MSYIVDIQNLEIGYFKSGEGGIPLLPPMNLSLNSGSLVGLIGANGSGKSTLLRTLSGLASPLSGNIFIQGKNAKDLTLDQKAKSISVVLTDTVSDPYLRVVDVVSMGRYPYTGFLGRLSPADKQQIEKGMEVAGVSALRHRPITQLSDGERQKVMIAKAIAQDTPIILLDEPAAFLDYPSKIDLMSLLVRLAHHEKKTILLSSHDLELVLKSADRIWLLGKGMQAIEGMPEKLVLNGVIGTYFNNTQLFEEPDDLSLIQHNSDKRVIFVAGSGSRAKWLKHALVRLGWCLGKSTDHAQIIYIKEIHYEYVKSDKLIIQTADIEDLLQALHAENS